MPMHTCIVTLTTLEVTLLPRGVQKINVVTTTTGLQPPPTTETACAWSPACLIMFAWGGTSQIENCASNNFAPVVTNSTAQALQDIIRSGLEASSVDTVQQQGASRLPSRYRRFQLCNPFVLESAMTGHILHILQANSPTGAGPAYTTWREWDSTGASLFARAVTVVGQKRG